VNDSGESALVGGWGYLLGDEGSGYWIGREGLRAVIRAADGIDPETDLTEMLLNALGLSHPRDLIPWLYRSDTARNRDMAGLAPLVLSATHDPAAQHIVKRAADELAQATQAVQRRLHLDSAGIAFTGGLLSSHNLLSQTLCARLGLPALPVPLHPPVIGAALLALIKGYGRDAN
jgi:N-acetylglucosamine kinase-like BadF-type ATPase